MQINQTSGMSPYSSMSLELNEQKRTEFKEKIESGEISGKTLSQAYLMEYSLQIQSLSSDNLQAQGVGFDYNKIKNILDNIDFDAIGYSGKPISQMSPTEASELVSEDGFFGVSQTSQRLADFVIMGGGDDIERLQAGREGIIKGFNEAEKIWGDKLPDISYQTLDKALEMIDERISQLGGNILDISM